MTRTWCSQCPTRTVGTTTRVARDRYTRCCDAAIATLLDATQRRGPTYTTSEEAEGGRLVSRLTYTMSEEAGGKACQQAYIHNERGSRVEGLSAGPHTQ
eukprot:259655-Chlamydomonas_euryale.AAC.1